MATQLSLYNEALRLCGERKLASLTEDRKPRRLLDDVWDDGAVDYCLEQGQWNFGMRSVKITYSPSVEPSFGLVYAFEKPDDLILLSAMSADEYYNEPLLQFSEEAGFWFADIDEIYVKYVSNDNEYGGDTSLWPQSFAKYFAAYMASEIVDGLTQSEDQHTKVLEKMKKRLSNALAKDSLQQATQFLPQGSWVRARGRGMATRKDNGKRNRLY